MNKIYVVNVEVKPTQMSKMLVSYDGAIVECYVNALSKPRAKDLTIAALKEDNFIIVSIDDIIKFKFKEWNNENDPDKKIRSSAKKALDSKDIVYGTFRAWRNENIEAHKFSSRHRNNILASQLCGCFYCLNIFKPDDIKDWIDEPNENTAEINNNGQTAICPFCGIDSVIGSKSGFPITEKFLKEMKNYWF